jgi:hypothetical protein
MVPALTKIRAATIRKIERTRPVQGEGEGSWIDTAAS